MTPAGRFSWRRVTADSPRTRAPLGHEGHRGTLLAPTGRAGGHDRRDVHLFAGCGRDVTRRDLGRRYGLGCPMNRPPHRRRPPHRLPPRQRRASRAITPPTVPERRQLRNVQPAHKECRRCVQSRRAYHRRCTDNNRSTPVASTRRTLAGRRGPRSLCREAIHFGKQDHGRISVEHDQVGLPSGLGRRWGWFPASRPASIDRESRRAHQSGLRPSDRARAGITVSRAQRTRRRGPGGCVDRRSHRRRRTVRVGAEHTGDVLLPWTRQAKVCILHRFRPRSNRKSCRSFRK